MQFTKTLNPASTREPKQQRPGSEILRPRALYLNPPDLWLSGMQFPKTLKP